MIIVENEVDVAVDVAVTAENDLIDLGELAESDVSDNTLIFVGIAAVVLICLCLGCVGVFGFIVRGGKKEDKGGASVNL